AGARPMRLQRMRGGIERALLVIGLALIAVWLTNEARARAFQSSASQALSMALRRGAPMEGGSPATFSRASIPHGVLGRIEIPRLRLSAVIVEGAEPAELERAIGHIAHTAAPGMPGNC